MKRPTLSRWYSDRGAQMGRRNTVEEPEAPIKFHLYLMPMSDGAYDSGGAYWGCGWWELGWMYHAYGEGPKFVNEAFVRAKSRDEAKAQILEVFENARFYR